MSPVEFKKRLCRPEGSRAPQMLVRLDRQLKGYVGEMYRPVVKIMSYCSPYTL